MRSLVSRVWRHSATLLGLAALAGCTDWLPTESGIEAPSARRATTAAAPAGHIRIGVVPETEEAHVGGTGSYRVEESGTGTLLLEGAGDEATVTLASVSVRRDFWRLQVACSFRGEAFTREWERMVALHGYEPWTEYVSSVGCWRLRVGRFPTRAAALAEQPELYRLGIAFGPSGGFPAPVTIFEGVTVYQVARGDVTVQSERPVRVVPQTGYLTIKGARYRGVGEVRVNSLGTLAAINELPIEDYLLGVVPRELGPAAFPYLEALKAQAVAARTYAYGNLGKRSNSGYDLLPTTSDQVYGGMAAEHPLSSQAVLETAGEVATHNGRLISALYSSTSGGWTANSEDVFISAEPYLRGVPDQQRGAAMDHVPSLEVFRNHANPTSLRAEHEGAFESDWSRLHRWYVDWTAAEMREVLSAYYRTDVGPVRAVNVVERSSSGRALRIEFVTDNGTFSETKDRIRTALKFVTSSGTHASLYSTLFFIRPVTDPSTKELKGFEAWGGGWGHGVGMSQTGAVGMAEKGATYDQILKHYYRGITLDRR